MLRDTLREAGKLRSMFGSEITNKAFHVNEEEQRILNSITHPPAGYRSVDELKSQFMEGTREELFEDTSHYPIPQLTMNHRTF